MRKSVKRLNLSKETLRALDGRASAAVGGIRTQYCDSAQSQCPSDVQGTACSDWVSDGCGGDTTAGIVCSAASVCGPPLD
jgi:hypothetical protein